MGSILGNVKNLLTDKLRSPLGRPIPEGYSSVNENARKAHFQRLFDYYIGDEDRIKLHTRRTMERLFKPETLDQMLYPYFNITKRITDRRALAYKVPAERYLLVPTRREGSEVIQAVEYVKAHELYMSILEKSNINSASKVWNRLAKLLDTIYVQPIFREDHIEYDIFVPHQLTVEEDPDNYLLPLSVSYIMATPDGERKVFWSDTEHWVLDDGDKPIPGMNEWNGVNKYGINPMVPLRLREVENHWGEGDCQLVDINEKINILLASVNYNAILQSHGQPFGVNLNIQGQLKTGPDWVIEARNVTKDDVVPDFKFVHPNPSIEANIKLIDYYVRNAAISRGLPPSAVSIEVNAQSGSAKAIDNWELTELREDDVEFLRPFEKKLFEVTRAVWNFHNSEKIPSDAIFGIDFALPKIPQTEVEELNAKQIKYSYGLWTPVDDMVDEDEGIGREQALQLVLENLEIKQQIDEKRTLNEQARAIADNEPSDSSGEGEAEASNGGDSGGNDTEQAE